MDAYTELNIALVVIGGLVIASGLLSRRLRRLGVPELLLALVVGVVIGPALMGLVRPAAWTDLSFFIENASRLTLGIGLMGVALRLPTGFFRKNWRSLAALLGPGMLIMWLFSALVIYVILGFPLPVCLLMGAVLTPTDPIVASSIVTGDIATENLPARIRHLISAESGANDGLAYPFVFFSLFLLRDLNGLQLLTSLFDVLIWEIGAAVLVGAAIGYGAGRLLLWAQTHGTIEVRTTLAYSLALAIATLGGVKLIGSDGILSVFVAGVVFNILIEREKEERAQIRREDIVDAINDLFTVPIFILLGMVLPWQAWAALGWPALALAVAMLLLRRIPMVFLVRPWIRVIHGLRDTLFTGWFGPIGVGAIFYASLGVRETGTDEIWVIGSLFVFVSLLAHGLSATPFTMLYGRLSGRR